MCIVFTTQHLHIQCIVSHLSYPYHNVNTEISYDNLIVHYLQPYFYFCLQNFFHKDFSREGGKQSHPIALQTWFSKRIWVGANSLKFGWIRELSSKCLNEWFPNNNHIHYLGRRPYLEQWNCLQWNSSALGYVLKYLCSTSIFMTSSCIVILGHTISSVLPGY